MRKLVRGGCLLAVGWTGCASVPPLENPVLVRPDEGVENPVLVSPGLPTPGGYAAVWEKVLDAVDDYFELNPGTRYGGQVETLPRVAPGYEQPWKPGSPDARERLLATFQSIRHYARIEVQPGEHGGYRVYVEVYKQLEDVPRPSQALVGGAAFREAPTVDRRLEVATVTSAPGRGWIDAGRDPAFEQVLLRKIQLKCR